MFKTYENIVKVFIVYNNVKFRSVCYKISVNITVKILFFYRIK
jgi:hypothetical protein